MAEQTNLTAPNLAWQDLETLADLESLRGHQDRKAAKVVRNHMRDYYNSPSGAVAWQDKAIEQHVFTNQITLLKIIQIAIMVYFRAIYHCFLQIYKCEP